MYCVLFLLLGVVCSRVSAFRDCNPDYEYACDDGHCVNKLQWCDTLSDCPDDSDEYYCNGANPCKDTHFPCRNGKCIPLIAYCDKYNDCGDSSDEENCHRLLSDDWQANSSAIETSDEDYESYIGINTSRNVKEHVVKAAEYLMKQRDTNYGWGSFTPRAIVAISFASRISPVSEKQELLKKQLNIQLLLDLMQNQDMTLSSLALYINALYATCQDPRHFQGIDLVSRLRFKTDTAIAANVSIPLAFLTLCIADEVNQYDKYKLAEMYNKQEFARTGSRALIMMAMKCYTNRTKSNLFFNYETSFFSENDVVADIHSKALFMQASVASGRPVALENLISDQLPDGSFGDMLATYYAIPVLMNSSLLDLKCNSTITGMDIIRSHGRNRIIYSLWIPTGSDVSAHSLTLTFDDDKTFFEIMLMAAARDPLFRFLYDDTDSGKEVYSIADIPNDAESGKIWMLYRGKINHVMVNSVQNLKMETLGVDLIFPEDENHFVFWFRRGFDSTLTLNH